MLASSSWSWGSELGVDKFSHNNGFPHTSQLNYEIISQVLEGCVCCCGLDLKKTTKKYKTLLFKIHTRVYCLCCFMLRVYTLSCGGYGVLCDTL